MPPSAIPLDTTPEAFDLLVERWRAMSMAERVELLDQIHADVEQMARTGIRAAAPDLTDLEVRYELTRRRYGAELADEAFRHLLA